MTIEDSPTVEKLIDQYQDLEYPDAKSGTPGKQGKKTSQSTKRMRKSTERYQVEKRQHKNKLALHRKLKARFAKDRFKQPYHRELAIRTYAQWLETLIGKNKSIHIDKEMERNIDAAYIASTNGPGGQNVNKVATKVRLTHIPTQITVDSKKRKISNSESNYC